MKKFIKNTLLSFVIIFTILNLVFFAFSVISKYYMINDVLNEYTGDNINVEASIEIEESAKGFIEQMRHTYGEDAPATELAMLNNYTMGMNHILAGQSTILITTVVLSIAIGTILSLTEKSKTKELLKFITVGISCVLLYTTIMYITGEYKGVKVFEAIIEAINSCGIYYIGAYLVKIVYTYCKNKKNVKELNKEIEKKNK